MNFIEEIKAYKPINEQETVDKQVILEFIGDYPNNVLTRDNRIAHITASAVIVNHARTKMLMIHHNIYDTWTWTGGHADGEPDMLKLAMKEASEETGLDDLRPLGGIRTIDVLWVQSHMKNGGYVGAHLHLNVAYVLEASEEDELVLNEEETSGLCWVLIEMVPEYSKEPDIVYIYKKLFQSIDIL